MFRVDIPSSPAPPSERRITGQTALWRGRPHDAVIDGGTGIGAVQPPQSEYETRPPRLFQHHYFHDQSAGLEWENNGNHVVIGAHPGWPRGRQEPSAGLPQRPTFRTPPEHWTAPLIEEG